MRARVSGRRVPRGLVPGPRRAAAAALLVACLGVTAPAAAFEREWHLGVGVGATDLTATGVGWGPEVGAHGAYGITDSFDVRLESRLALLPVSHRSVDEWRGFLRTEAALAYKIDILRWVPWISVGAGYFLAFEEPLPVQDLRRHDGLVSGMLGLDYAVSRSFGVGVVGRSAFLFAGSWEYGAQLRAEYRWGF